MRIKNIFRKKIVLFGLIFLLAFGLGKIIGDQFTEQSVQTKVSSGKQVNILLMGIDARSNETNSRSDTMILASIDGKNKKVALVWIPRDTRVEVSPKRYDRINSVNYIKGPEAACKVVSDLLGIPVNYYVVSNFNGFARIIDILGGVDINVEHDMYHWDPDPKLQINLSQGQQRLDGQQALSFVRFRGVPTADIGRTGLQQTFVKALAEEVLQGSTILKLPRLLPEIAKNVKTNIPADDMVYLAKTAKDFKTEDMITQTLPGYSYTDPASGASYWQADEKIANGLVAALFAGETFEVAQARPSWVKQKPAPSSSPGDSVEASELEAGQEEQAVETEEDLSSSEGYLEPVIPGEKENISGEEHSPLVPGPVEGSNSPENSGGSGTTPAPVPPDEGQKQPDTTQPDPLL